MDAPKPMPAPGNPTAPSRPAAAGPSAGKDRGLVSVVWCRQVDNEAESPGYTTVPTEFPGRKETLDAVRIVGNLAINAADTHDYWDPDPTSKLAYYHNLFLYPANGGQYLCLGRMFLSTEDRPRLGMKTLILDASALLESENLGLVLRRWYNSMGNPGRGAQTEGRADPAMMDALSDAFVYLRLDPGRPLVGLVSDNFHDAVEGVLTLLERMPSSVALLGGCLIFPYFLPVGRVQVTELTETFPLTLALARIPRNEAGGDRHVKRVSAWAAQGVHLLDLTQGLSPEVRSRPAAGPPISWWCKGDRPELINDLRRAVDRVELPRLRESEQEGNLRSGSERRRELARLASAMSSITLALQRPPSERSTLGVEILRTVQPYLQALSATAGSPAEGVRTPGTLPEAPSTGPAAPSVVPVGGIVVTPPLGMPPKSSSSQEEPPWRRAPRLRPERSEVVPVPRGAPGGEGPPGDERVGAGSAAAPPVPPGVDRNPPDGDLAEASPPPAAVPGLPPALLEELRSYIDTRIGESRVRVGDLDPDVVGGLERDLERRLEARARLLVSPEALEARVVEILARRPPPPTPEPQDLLNDATRGALAEVVDVLVAERLADATAGGKAGASSSAEDELSKLDDRVVALLSKDPDDRRVAALLDQRIQACVASSAEADRKATDDRLDLILKELQLRAKSQTELEATIRSEVRFLDEKLQTLMGRMIPLLKRTWLKIDELEKRPAGAGGASEQKMKRLRDELWREMKRMELDLSERTRLILDRVEGNIQNQGKLWLTLVGQLSSLAEQRRELEKIVHESKEDFEVPAEDGPLQVPEETSEEEGPDEAPKPTTAAAQTGKATAQRNRGTAKDPAPSTRTAARAK